MMTTIPTRVEGSFYLVHDPILPTEVQITEAEVSKIQLKGIGNGLRTQAWVLSFTECNSP